MGRSIACLGVVLALCAVPRVAGAQDPEEEWPPAAAGERVPPPAEPAEEPAPPAAEPPPPEEAPPPLPPVVPEREEPRGVSFGVNLLGFLHWNETNLEHEQFDAGNEIDVDRETPLDAFTGAAQVDLWVAFLHHWRLEGGWLGARYDGKGRLHEGLVHSGVGFNPGERVRVELEWQMAWGGARFDFVVEDGLRLGLPFGLAWTTERLTLESRDDGDRRAKRVEAVFGYLGFYAGFEPVERLGIDFELRAFPYPAYLDVRLAFRYEVVEDHVALVAGPRVVLFAFEKEVSNRNDRVLELAAGGLFAGVALSY